MKIAKQVGDFVTLEISPEYCMEEYISDLNWLQLYVVNRDEYKDIYHARIKNSWMDRILHKWFNIPKKIELTISIPSLDPWTVECIPIEKYREHLTGDMYVVFRRHSKQSWLPVMWFKV